MKPFVQGVFFFLENERLFLGNKIWSTIKCCSENGLGYIPRERNTFTARILPAMPGTVLSVVVNKG